MKTESITLSSGLQVNRTVTKRCGHNVTIITTGAIKKHSHAYLIINRIRNIFFANYKKLALIMILVILNACKSTTYCSTKPINKNKGWVINR